MAVFDEDLDRIVQSNLIHWNRFNNKNIFITGGTGLIGSTIIKVLSKVRETLNLDFKLILLVRNIDKAKKLFNDSSFIEYVIGDLENFKYEYHIDYVIHAASPTKSKFFVTYPIETLNSAIYGTKNILELASKNNISSMVYLSSMEAYGLMNDDYVSENKLGYINLQDARSCYPEGKRVSEFLCSLYAYQKEVPVKIARLAMTFGAGIAKEENRVYKQFADSVIQKKDIVLKSSGLTQINFVYLADAVEAIFIILLNGNNNEVYNVVSDPTNMTIKESAEWLIKKYAPNCNVVFDDLTANHGLAPDNNMILINEKLKSLGWFPKIDIKNGYDRLIQYLKETFYNQDQA